ncbi:MAG: MarR family transcriptional regulator [Bryobacteraceae bacterium]|nr:MarR family transcriptional regulator [Bryobacteraceae bacterium]
MGRSRKERWRDNLGFLVNKLAARMQASFEGQLAPYKISRLQWIVLRDLYDASHRPANLAVKTGCDRAVMTRVLEGLQQRGLLVRTIAEQDRRQIDVSLTETGRALTKELILVARKVNDHFLKRIPEDRAGELIRLLTEILTDTEEKGVKVA